ncbi:MAG: hypothetical protein GEU80_11180 [Dehalococcoidia bacterium]|nr:hypothetical protein [Dehalococcoidia bacterium]
MPRNWKTGDHSVLRFVGHDNGVVMGYPQVVVETTAEHVMIYQPAGVHVRNVPCFEDLRSRLLPGESRLPPDYRPPLSIVRILPRGAEHAVEIFLAEDDQPTPGYLPWLAADGRFRGWKVNLQARFVEHALGFDTTDNTLDVVAGPDGRWSWKDEDALEARVAVGLTWRQEADRWRIEGERVAARLDRREWPFVAGWDQWQPDAAWGVPVLPTGWETLEGFERDLNRVRPD